MSAKRAPVQWTSGQLENHKLSLGGSEEVTYFINEAGNDSSSSPYSIYLGFGREAISITVRATVACSLIEWNGKVLKSPITINAGTNTMDALCNNFKIVSTAATILEITVK